MGQPEAGRGRRRLALAALGGLAALCAAGAPGAFVVGGLAARTSASSQRLGLAGRPPGTDRGASAGDLGRSGPALAAGLLLLAVGSRCARSRDGRRNAAARRAAELDEETEALMRAGMRNLLGVEENRMAQKLKEALDDLRSRERSIAAMEKRQEAQMDQLLAARAQAIEEAAGREEIEKATRDSLVAFKKELETIREKAEREQAVLREQLDSRENDDASNAMELRAEAEGARAALEEERAERAKEREAAEAELAAEREAAASRLEEAVKEAQEEAQRQLGEALAAGEREIEELTAAHEQHAEELERALEAAEQEEKELREALQEQQVQFEVREAELAAQGVESGEKLQDELQAAQEKLEAAQRELEEARAEAERERAEAEREKEELQAAAEQLQGELEQIRVAGEQDKASLKAAAEQQQGELEQVRMVADREMAEQKAELLAKAEREREELQQQWQKERDQLVADHDSKASNLQTMFDKLKAKMLSSPKDSEEEGEAGRTSQQGVQQESLAEVKATFARKLEIVEASFRKELEQVKAVADLEKRELQAKLQAYVDTFSSTKAHFDALKGDIDASLQGKK